MAVRDDVLGRLSGVKACTSVLKLRTALYAYARMADLGNGVRPLSNPDPRSTMGPNFEHQMRATLRRLHTLLTDGPSDDVKVAHAIRLTVRKISSSDAFDRSEFVKGAGLRLGDLHTATPGASIVSGFPCRLYGVFGWHPSSDPDAFGFGVGYDPRGMTHSRYRVLAEVQWHNQDQPLRPLWSVAKLTGALVHHTDSAYLIGTFPERVWKRAPWAALYTDGTTELRSLVEQSDELPLDNGNTGPLMLPKKVLTREIARIPFRQASNNRAGRNQEWEIRAVVIEPSADGWHVLHNDDRDKLRQPRG